MNVEGVGGDGGEEALEHAQLDALVGDVVAAAQQLHRLGLRGQSTADHVPYAGNSMHHTRVARQSPSLKHSHGAVAACAGL